MWQCGGSRRRGVQMDLRVSLLIASSGCRISIVYLAKIAILDKGGYTWIKTSWVVEKGGVLLSKKLYFLWFFLGRSAIVWAFEVFFLRNWIQFLWKILSQSVSIESSHHHFSVQLHSVALRAHLRYQWWLLCGLWTSLFKGYYLLSWPGTRPSIHPASSMCVWTRVIYECIRIVVRQTDTLRARWRKIGCSVRNYGHTQRQCLRIIL